MKLEQLLDEHGSTLAKINSRLSFLLEFEKQLAGMTQRKSFRIKNDIVYRLIIDSWDMVVIDFASLSKGMLGDCGFFNHLKANLHKVVPLKRKEIEPPKGTINFVDHSPTEEEISRVSIDIDKHFVDTLMAANRATLFDLFPNAKGRDPLKIRHTDVDKLKQRFEDIIRDVVDDRNNHRAHKYEKVQEDFSCERLNFSKLAERYKQVRDILEKIKLVTTKTSYHDADMNYANKTETSKDLLMMILWGSNKLIDNACEINERLNPDPTVHVMDRVYGYMLREQLVEKSHSYHDRIVSGDLKLDSSADYSDRKFCFNDVNIEKMKSKGL